jgi:hypothetical protein
MTPVREDSAAGGVRDGNKDIAAQLGIGRDTAGQWRYRLAERRLAELVKDARREEVTQLIVERTLQTNPADATHWNTRTLGKQLGVSPSMVQRVWQGNGLKRERELRPGRDAF